MVNVIESISGFFTLIIAVFILSEIVKALPTPVLGLNFGPLFLGVFIFFGIFWFIKEVFGR